MPDDLWSGYRFDNESFGARIEEARIAYARDFGRTLSQNELEKRAGIARPGQKAPAYLAAFRKGSRGESVKREWLVKLAVLLRVELMWLLCGVGPMRSPTSAPPKAGRDLGLYFASLLGCDVEAIEAARKDLDESADPLLVATNVRLRAAKEEKSTVRPSKHFR